MRYWKQIAIIVVGVLILIGCIPMPASHQYMINGKPKPARQIGTDADDPIRIGVTTIDEAIEYFTEHVAGRDTAPPLITYMPMTHARQVRSRWLRIDDGRHYVLPYQLRTGYLLMPLCFTATGNSRREYLVLEVNDQKIVTGFEIRQARDWQPTLDQQRDGQLFPMPRLIVEPTTQSQPTTQP